MAAQVQLSRKRVAPLLSVVGGKSRNSPCGLRPDNVQSSPNPEDSPISSDDNDDEFGSPIPATKFIGLSHENDSRPARNGKEIGSLGKDVVDASRSARKNRKANSHAKDDQAVQRSDQSSTPGSSKKRKLAITHPSPSEDESDTDMFGSIRSSQGVHRRTYGQRGYTQSIHASPKNGHGKRDPKRPHASYQKFVTPNAPSELSLPAFKPPPQALEEDANELTSFQAPRVTRSSNKLGAKHNSFVPPVLATSSRTSTSSFNSFKELNPSGLLDARQPNEGLSTSLSPPSSPIAPGEIPNDTLEWNSTNAHDSVNPLSTTVPCPLCKLDVPRTAWESFVQRHGRRIKMRQQRQFCHEHRRESVLAQWNIHQYPTIDWQSLPERLAAQNSLLVGIITCEIWSYYREELSKRTSKGLNRNDLRFSLAMAASETHSPGYYGLRGARVLLDHVTQVFSNHVRMGGIPDTLIARTSLSGYLQGVLVPELATSLIMHDMGVGAEKAREILRSSADDGDLVHGEEEEDEDKDEDEDEDENGPNEVRIDEIEHDDEDVSDVESTGLN